MADYFDSVQTQLSGLCAQQAHRQRRRPRLHRPGLSTVMLLASAAITVAVAVLALGLLSAGRHSAGQPPSGHRPAAAVARPAVLRGIPQRGRVLGDHSARVEITFVADLECPICRQFTLDDAFREFVRNDVRSGRVKLDFRSLCTSTCSAPGERKTSAGKPSTFVVQQAAAYAAGRQNRLWDYALLFFKKQGHEGAAYVTASYLTRLARQVQGLNLRRWQADRKKSTTLAEVSADTAYTQAHHIDATPTLVVSGTKGAVTLVGGQTSYQQLAHAIARVQGRSSPTPISPQLPLEANGIAQAHFRTPEGMTLAILGLRFGGPAIVRGPMGCDEAAWIGLQLGPNGQTSAPATLPVELRVVFKRSSFVGYSYSQSAESRAGAVDQPWLRLATSRGLTVGSSPAMARSQYGAAFVVGRAVMGAGVPWTITTPTGRISGEMTIPEPHFHQIIQTINAGTNPQAPCP